MGKKGIRIMKWKCARCMRIFKSKKRPVQCKFCWSIGPFYFYGATVIKIG